MKHELRSALHLAVYIREMGIEPVPLRNFKIQEWANTIENQYGRLRKLRGVKATKAARLRGRVLIGEKGLLAAAADSLPRPMPGERLRCLACSKWTWPTLESALPALEALRTAPGTRRPGSLAVYRCPRDYGWHLGHNYIWPGGSLCVGEHK